MPTVYCRCAFAQVIPEATKNAKLEELSAAGEAFTAVPDLCEMAARRDPQLAELAASDDVEIIACHPRAVHGLFIQAGCPLGEGARITNMREPSPAPSTAPATGT